MTTYSDCTSCNRLFPSDIFSICPKCHTELNEKVSSEINQSTQGDNSPIQNGVGNTQNVIINPVPEEDKKTLIYRSSIKPLSVGSARIKSWWLMFSGGVTVIANLITALNGIGSLLNHHEPASFTLPILTMPIGILLFLLGFMLQRNSYLPMLFGRIIERDRSGALYNVKIAGTCSRCDHDVKAERVGESIAIVCKNNPNQHRWIFDPTILGDVGDDYLEKCKT